jgi:hypothetical protein
MDDKKEKRIFDKITTVVGCVFFGAWAIGGTYYFCKAVVEFIFRNCIK